MKIRQADEDDINSLVEVDKKSYDDYGADRDYFSRKIKPFPQGVLVFEEDKKVTGFIVFDLLDKDNLPEDFCDMDISEPIKGKWIYIAAFTTKTNYKDKKSDSKLLLEAEKVAKSRGAEESCVPLSKEHPYKQHGVFEFWEMNNYRSVGEIKWRPSSDEFIECWFYKKEL